MIFLIKGLESNYNVYEETEGGVKKAKNDLLELPENAKSASTKCFLDLTLDICSKKYSPTRNPGTKESEVMTEDTAKLQFWRTLTDGS